MGQLVCFQTYIPVRLEPSHQSEQVSQVIFGETMTILRDTSEWYYISADYDNYKGWIEKKVSEPFNKEENQHINLKSFFLTSDSNYKVLIPPGAILRFNKDNKLITAYNTFDINPTNLESTVDFISIASQFLGSPYLWGGRTPYGIDCSGFTQIVMKCRGIKLPRDASGQVSKGDEVPFLKQAKQGDLAFFENVSGNITHVGILLENNRIIHASGNVRIDKIDQEGIYNETKKIYTHKLRVIKRLA